MVYTPYNWQNNDPGTPLSAANLNHIEQGISQADSVARNALPSNANSNMENVDFNNVEAGIIWFQGKCPNSPKPTIGTYGFLMTVTFGTGSKFQFAVMTWDGVNSQGFYYRTFVDSYDTPWSPWSQVDYNNAAAASLSVRSMADVMVRAASATPQVMADQPSTVTDDIKAYIDSRVSAAIAEYAGKVKTLADTDAESVTAIGGADA